MYLYFRIQLKPWFLNLNLKPWLKKVKVHNLKDFVYVPKTKRYNKEDDFVDARVDERFLWLISQYWSMTQCIVILQKIPTAFWK